MSRADYGIDAPPVVRNLAVGGAAIVIVGILFFKLTSMPHLLSLIIGYWGILAGGSMVLTALLMVWSSKVGKLRQREMLIASLKLKGNETVLDVGCGRGLLLNEAAKHLPHGKAIGVDLWQTMDQSGNKPEVTLENARAEGVAERVEVRTGDMRELPLPDGSVDAVVASLSIHNIPTKEGRAKAIQEIHRVLKPGGQIGLLDFMATDEYLAAFQALGWEMIDRSGSSFWIFPPVRVVSGRKPG
ncbi:MAG TPA: class I SAM-dependent methyltransferase [Anaerolineales bacterium]|nr:class I SAM-dependent methyltransferase [Anaerolineales bacterium]